jgi:histidine triad (HIT) family protein
MDDCIFCKIAAGTILAKEVARDEDLVAFHDMNPQAPVHVLVIPHKHVATLNDLAESDASLLGRIWLKIPKLADSLGIGHVGYRVVVNCLAPAGQSVFHIHFHLLGGRSMNWPPG